MWACVCVCVCERVCEETCEERERERERERDRSEGREQERGRLEIYKRGERSAKQDSRKSDALTGNR